MKEMGKWVSLAIAGFIAVAVLLHAKQFSIAAGTLFGGFNATGRTLEGR